MMLHRLPSQLDASFWLWPVDNLRNGEEEADSVCGGANDMDPPNNES